MTKVKVLIGDIFKSNMQTLVNTVNCVGIMGKGLALEFKKRFPDMFKDYQLRCQRVEVKLGKPYLYKSLVSPWILVFPTKDHWRSFAKLSDIEEGLRYLESHYREWGITSIAVPPLGCGLGELEWKVVGRTLYRRLAKLKIPVELYAPPGTPNAELTSKFLGEPHLTQLVEAGKFGESRIEPGLIALVEVLSRLEKRPYHCPAGRIVFQKIAYFGTSMGLDTGLRYQRSSFGPFSPELKAKLTKLVNNGLIYEKQVGSMFEIKVGHTFRDARKTYSDAIQNAEQRIEKLTDFFCRIRTSHQAELIATIHFARQTMEVPPGTKPTETDVLKEVMKWKQRRRPPYDEITVAKTIRNMAVHGLLDVKASDELLKEVEEELYV